MSPRASRVHHLTSKEEISPRRFQITSPLPLSSPPVPPLPFPVLSRFSHPLPVRDSRCQSMDFWFLLRMSPPPVYGRANTYQDPLPLKLRRASVQLEVKDWRWLHTIYRVADPFKRIWQLGSLVFRFFLASLLGMMTSYCIIEIDGKHEH
jgi:hypothetical protein